MPRVVSYTHLALVFGFEKLHDNTAYDGMRALATVFDTPETVGFVSEYHTPVSYTHLEEMVPNDKVNEVLAK